jgi:hypothetical protein
MKMTQQVGVAFIAGFAGYFLLTQARKSLGADTVVTTDPFQQAEFDSLPPMPLAGEVVDNMMLRDDTNEALLAQNAPMIAPPELNMVNLLAAIKGTDNLPTPATVTV